MIKLLIADDHSIVRDGLKQLFSLTQDLHIEKEAQNGDEALRILQSELAFDLFLMDMNMPGVNGVELIKASRIVRPSLPILVFSMHNTTDIAMSSLKHGASGYFSKNSDPKLLIDAIRKVREGKRVIDPAIAEQIAINSALPEKSHSDLTEREVEILKLIALGNTVNQVALNLGVSNKTVSAHKANLMSKMGFESNTDIMRYAIQNGLISPI